MILALIPVLYLSGTNHATGDDLGYSAFVHDALCQRNGMDNLGTAFKATLKEYYFSWQGTWFSIILFSLQPGIFGEKWYVVVTPLTVLCWFGSTFYLFYHILIKRMGTDREGWITLTVVFLLVSMEFIPSTKSSLYWYNGIVHYMLPFSMCQLMAVWIIKYSEEKKARYLLGTSVFAALLGGSSYQCALIAFILLVYAVARRAVAMILPAVFNVAGLIVSALSPGNRVRGGEDFGFFFPKIVSTIGDSFLQEGKEVYEFIRKPFQAAMLLFLILLTVYVFSDEPKIKTTRYPLITSLLLWCLASAVKAPAIYAGVEVSGGVYNIEYQTMLVAVFGTTLLFSSVFGKNLKKKTARNILFAGILACLVLAFVGKSGVKETLDYKAARYVLSGEAMDYREQMKIQDGILLSGERDVIIPTVNDEQGPLMSMPVTDDPEGFTNIVTRKFYDLDSIHVTDRAIWESKKDEK